MEPGSDRLKIKTSGVDLSLNMDGTVKLIDLIPLTATGLNFTNVTLNMELEFAADSDDVHWRLVETSYIHFGTMQIYMQNPYLQKLVNKFSGLISKLINLEGPILANKVLDKLTSTLNNAVAHEGPTTFAIPIKNGIEANMTMTQAPDLRTHDLVKIFFNGLMLANNKTSETIQGIQTPPRRLHDLSEQMWIHENMVDSLIQAGSKTLFPMTYKSESISTQLKQVFMEIGKFYGKDVEVAMNFSLNSGD